MSTFKLTPRTLDILKNFQSINPSIVFRPGKKLTTMSIGKKVLAFADVEEKFDGHFGIYELNKFFGAVSLFKDPDITFDNYFLLIKDGTRSLTYTVADPLDVVAPDDDTINELPEVNVEFMLTEKMIKDALKAAGVLNQPHIVFEGDGNTITVATHNMDKPTNEVYKEDVGTFTGVLTPFKIINKIDNLKLFPGDYTVRICFKLKALQFVGKDVTYLVAAEAKSTVS